MSDPEQLIQDLRAVLPDANLALRGENVEYDDTTFVPPKRHKDAVAGISTSVNPNGRFKRK